SAARKGARLLVPTCALLILVVSISPKAESFAKLLCLDPSADRMGKVLPRWEPARRRETSARLGHRLRQIPALLRVPLTANDDPGPWPPASHAVIWTPHPVAFMLRPE